MIGAGDTIAAIATAPGPAGVGIVRLSGPDAAAILSRLSGRPAATFADRRLVPARLVDERGALLDTALCVVMRGPRSFTGEDVVELHGHGGVVNLGRLVRAALACGARMAEPGEFSRRALAAGKLDLVQAEALLAVVEAASERALEVAQRQLAGELGARLGELESGVVEALAELEAAIDFPEEGLEVAGVGALAARLGALGAACGALAASHALGRALRDGVEVALRGPVNAGKSSLFNALLGSERALVAAEPGTTRDYLEARTTWDGVPVMLIDTAGEREAEVDVERRGIALGARRAAEADVEVWLVPLDGERAAADEAPSADGRRLVVVSKADLAGADTDADAAVAAGGVAAGGVAAGGVAARDALRVSALSGAGLDSLRAAILERALGGGAAGAGRGEVLISTERQRHGLATASAALERASAAAAAGRPEELVALEVRAARVALAGVRGQGVDDEVLDALFARFCIGK